MKEIINEYSEALFALAIESGEIEGYFQNLSEIKKLVTENPEYTDFLSCPSIPLSERVSAIDEAFSKSCHEDIVSFLRLLTEKGRIRELIPCIDEFSALKLIMEETMTVTVYSKIPLSDEQKEKLIKKLSEKNKKKIHAVYEIDETLLGGIKIVAGDLIIDGSIKNALKDLKEVIEK